MSASRWVTTSGEEALVTRTLISDTTGLTAMRVAFDLPTSSPGASRTITHGTYFSVNEEIEAEGGLPIMPRTSVSVTLANAVARGAFFEGGRYQSYTSFDPVIAGLVTDTAAHLAEPLYDFQEWVPAAWDLVNSLNTPEGLLQRLVILPAQYRATSLQRGEMRVFQALTYTVYYSDTEDTEPPSFWLVQDAQVGDTQLVTVEVTDHSGIVRVALAYTWGQGRWATVNLTPTVGDPDVWTGTLPYSDTLAYFVQALDGAGNVGLETNKGWYLGRDTYPPLTLALFEPPLPSAENGWDRSPVTITLSAKDERSGVAYTLYQVRAGDWHSYTVPLTVTAQGTTTVAYYSVDAVGNVEAVQTATVKLDSLAPTTTAHLTPTVSGDGWHHTPVTVTLVAVDGASGVAHTVYRVDGADWQTYTLPITVTTQGTTTLSYYSADRAGNVEAVQTTTVKLDLNDTAAPTTEAQVAPPAVDGWHRSSPVTLTLTAQDDASGVDYTVYRVNGSTWQTYTAPIVVTTPGTTTVSYYSVDVVGNAETVQTATVRLDWDAPATTATLDPPIPDGANGWYWTPVTLTLSADDGLSGVDHTAYRLNAGDWQTYAALPITITGAGTISVSYHSVDIAGNVETVQTTTVRLDRDAPGTTATLDPPTPDGGSGWYRTPVTLTLSADDGLSGVDHTAYRLSAGDWQTYALPITVTSEGTTTVSYHSVDIAGNVEAAQTATVKLDPTPPASHADAPASSSGSIAVTWIATDTSSGVSAVSLWRTSGAGGTWEDSGLSPQSGSSGTFHFTPGGTGTYCFATRATDWAGNVEAAPDGSGDACCEYTTGHRVYLPLILRDDL